MGKKAAEWQRINLLLRQGTCTKTQLTFTLRYINRISPTVRSNPIIFYQTNKPTYKGKLPIHQHQKNRQQKTHPHNQAHGVRQPKAQIQFRNHTATGNHSAIHLQTQQIHDKSITKPRLNIELGTKWNKNSSTLRMSFARWVSGFKLKIFHGCLSISGYRTRANGLRSQQQIYRQTQQTQSNKHEDEQASYLLGKEKMMISLFCFFF